MSGVEYVHFPWAPDPLAAYKLGLLSACLSSHSFIEIILRAAQTDLV
jgi:hypothetical protein